MVNYYMKFLQVTYHAALYDFPLASANKIRFSLEILADSHYYYLETVKCNLTIEICVR